MNQPNYIEFALPKHVGVTIKKIILIRMLPKKENYRHKNGPKYMTSNSRPLPKNINKY